MALAEPPITSYKEHQNRMLDAMKGAEPSFKKISGARSSLTEAFKLQEMTGLAHDTPTKQRRIARKVERWVAEHQPDNTMGSSHGASSSHCIDPYLAYPQMKPAFRERDSRSGNDDAESFIIVEDDDATFSCTRDQCDQPFHTLRGERPTSSIWGSTLPRLKSRLSMTFQKPGTFRGSSASQYMPRSSSDMIAENSAVTTSSQLQPLDSPRDCSTSRFMSWIPANSLSSTSKDSVFPFRASSPKIVRSSILDYFSYASSTSSDITSPTTSTSAPRSSLASSSSYIASSSAASDFPTPGDQSPDPRHWFSSFRTSQSRHCSSVYNERRAAVPSVGQQIDDQLQSEEKTPKPALDHCIPLESSRSFLRAVPSVFVFPNDKKKKLVVAGIPVGDLARERGLRLWSAAQGEISRLVRMKNGDIHVHYKNMEVAEEVCCIQGPVVMPGVGRVTLSWFRGRPPA